MYKIFTASLALMLSLASFSALAQTPGQIYQRASPNANPMDPNGDGWTSKTSSGFATGTENFMEVPFVAIPQVSREPVNDLRSGGSCGNTEIIDNPASGADASYVYFKNPDGIANNGDEILIYRIRLAKNASGAFGFSVLLDSDGKIGNGAAADPNFIAPSGNRPGNPGFEFEIVYITGGNSNGVSIYYIDGTTNGVPITTYAEGSNSQRSYAFFNDTGCSTQAVFYDFFIPIGVMGLTSSSSIRLAAATAIRPGPVFGGESDIAGVNDNLFPIPDDAYIKLVQLQNPTPIDNLDETGCFINGVTATPSIQQYLYDSQTTISGTTTASTAAEKNMVSLYLNNSLWGSVAESGGNWSFNLNAYTLRPYDRITVTAKDPCKYASAVVERYVIDDLDSDNDGVPDTAEGRGQDPGADIDGDRIPNFKDPDYTGFRDSNGDGIHDFLMPTPMVFQTITIWTATTMGLRI